MNLKKLITGLPIKIYKEGKEDLFLSGLCSHSKLVAPGNLFIAKKGAHDDGTKYVEEAVESGAIAILTDFPNPFLQGVTQLITQNVKEMEAEIAKRFYGDPSSSLFMIGVTGTNGKTTIAYLIKHIFDSYGLTCGLIGTIEYIIGHHHFSAELTTPEVITNQKLLKEMVKQKCQASVMEVSSIGVDQGRVDQIHFDIGIFSNLSQDHLDYHQSMEKYAASKAKFFAKLGPDNRAILNADSDWFQTMKQACQAPPLTYGFQEGVDLRAHSLELQVNQTKFCVTYLGKTLSFSWGLIGRFNLYNALASIGAALCRGIPFEVLPKLIACFSSVPGRLERVGNINGFNIFVDYAHTPDALEKVLLTLQEIKKGKIITVFGCGGNRDRVKRPSMGTVAEMLSDFIIVTSDNPRLENPLSICQEIEKGFCKDQHIIEVDRRKAIELAIEMATSEDLILIAGKGHETYQIFAHQTIPFDDRRVAQESADRILI